ncbi:MAG: translocation/assembly module TamB domain-containing protein [Candidatus Aminicenantes bacterium]
MKITRREKSLIILAVIVVLVVGGIALKNILLHQIKKKIQSSIGYTHLHLSFFPPSLVLEEARFRSPTPFLSADKIVVRISYRALLSEEKPLNVVIHHPVIRIYPSSATQEKGRFSYSLPFDVEKGLIKEGEFYFWGKDRWFQAKGVNALLRQKRDKFSLKARAEESLLYLASAGEQIKGKLDLFLNGQGREMDVEKLSFTGPDLILKAEGSLVDPFDPELRLKTYLNIQTPLLARLIDLPFDWEGKAEARGRMVRDKGSIAFRGGFSSPELIWNQVTMGKATGKIVYGEKTGGTVEVGIQKKASSPQWARIHFKKGRVWGDVRRFHLEPIMNHVSFPWPVSSPVWGNFVIEEGNLRVDGEFRDGKKERPAEKFFLEGPANFHLKSDGEFSFSSKDLTSDFARISIQGRVNTKKTLDIRINGEVKDLSRARRFTSIILSRDFNFPETRGKGQAGLRVFGDYQNPQVESDFALSPGGFDEFEAHSVKGRAKIMDGHFFGWFDVDDPFLKGKIDLHSGPEMLTAAIQVERGRAEKIFPALNIRLPLRGEASGDFGFQQKGEESQVKGKFSSPQLRYADQKLKDLSGEIFWDQHSLAFSDLEFQLYQGRIKGNLSTSFSGHEFAVHISAEGIDLGSVHPAIKGSLGFKLQGKGIFGQDWASGPFEIKDMELNPLKGTAIKGKARAGYSSEEISLELDGNVLPGENQVKVSFNYPFTEEYLSAEIKGAFHNLDLILPWRGAEGNINYLTEIKGPPNSLQLKGVVDFSGNLLPLPRFAHALHDYSGLLFVENSEVTLRSLKAKLGGGDIQGSGEIKLGKGGVEKVNIKVEGKNLLLSPLERTRVLAGGTLNLIKDPQRFLLDGEFSIQKLSWRRELGEEIVFYSSPYYRSSKEPGFFEDLSLNLRFKADQNAWMENSLGRIRTRFDLTVVGSVNAPVLLGDIEAVEGNVYFQDRKFKVLRGVVSFFNPSVMEPYLNFKGETYIKNYRVTFSLTGFIDHLNPEFNSSPPLPPEDVLALLTMGEAFKRTYSYEKSTQLSTASLLSFQISEEAKKRAQSLFRLDRFRIDPFILGSSAEMTARLTLGKKISRDFFILYSTNLTTQREELARLEWELIDDFSVVGIRDERGRLSIDVKIHKRF